MSSRTASLLMSSRSTHVFSLLSSRTARSAEPGSSGRHANACAAHSNDLRARPLQLSHWIPGSACGGPGMTPESKTARSIVHSFSRHPPRRRTPCIDVIPDVSLSDILLEAPPSDVPRMERPLLLMSSRTCPLLTSSRTASLLDVLLDAPFLMSSRTAHRAEPGSRQDRRERAAPDPHVHDEPSGPARGCLPGMPSHPHTPWCLPR